MGRRSRGIEDELGDVVVQSFRLSKRLTWKHAFLLGVCLFLVLGVAIPLGLEWWVHRQSESMTGPGAARLGHVFERAILLRFILPFKILGSLAGIGCMLVASWKAIAEARKP